MRILDFSACLGMLFLLEVITVESGPQCSNHRLRIASQDNIRAHLHLASPFCLIRDPALDFTVSLTGSGVWKRT